MLAMAILFGGPRSVVAVSPTRTRRSASLQLIVLLFSSFTLPVFAADHIVLKDGQVHDGQVTKADANNVYIKMAFGELSFPKSDIDFQKSTFDKPAGYDAAVAAVKAEKFSDAVAALKPIVDRYAGLPTPWAQDAMLQLGDAYIGLKDFAPAKKTFDSFAALYPQSPLLGGLKAKYARILIEQKDCSQAMQSLQEMLDPLLKKDSLTEQEELAAANALIALGDCQREAKAYNDALDSYLLVVAVFDFDLDLAAQAKYKAAQVFEQMGNWKRAQRSYTELLKEAPKAAFADDAQKRLAALNQAHSE